MWGTEEAEVRDAGVGQKKKKLKCFQFIYHRDFFFPPILQVRKVLCRKDMRDTSIVADFLPPLLWRSNKRLTPLDSCNEEAEENKKPPNAATSCQTSAFFRAAPPHFISMKSARLGGLQLTQAVCRDLFSLPQMEPSSTLEEEGGGGRGGGEVGKKCMCVWDGRRGAVEVQLKGCSMVGG